MRRTLAASDSAAGVSPAAAWGLSSAAVLESLAVDPEEGLSTAEALRRREKFGPNELVAESPRKLSAILISQFRSMVVALLLSAGVLALAFGEIAEGLAIFAVVLINATIGFVTEWRAIRSMEALRQFARADCVRLRDGRITRAPADTLVPGDIVLFEAGDLVPADLRVVEAAKLAADESTLTGESLPVRKHDSPLAPDTAVLDRHNLVYKGTCITRGAGKGVVVGTGRRTEFGKIFSQVVAAKAQRTPLEERINALGAGLVWAILAVAVLIGAAGIVAGRGLFLAIEVAIALAVAAIPEGLVIVATIALARGMWRLAKQNALITRLSAVETLGATSVILTDKTGTLTENRMAVSRLILDGIDVEVVALDNGAPGFVSDGKALAADEEAQLDALCQAAALCNNAALEADADEPAEGVGDPTEVALLVLAGSRGIWRRELLHEMPEIFEDPFDPDAKRMATMHRQDGGFRVAAKGAPEALIPSCAAVRTRDGIRTLDPAHRERWLQSADALGAKGLRTIAVAAKDGPDEFDEPYKALTLLGIVGLEDPARRGVDGAIDRCRRAGIDVVMVTGDHAATARNIAIEVGIVRDSADDARFLGGPDVDRLLAQNEHAALLAARVFSRVTPEQKLRLIDLYQQRGHVVAMTGDGVNDAPALKKANIGVAMGVRGTAVAKEAAVMVLQDDEFETIVAAVAQGRTIFSNIRKFVLYLLSCNTSEVLVVSLATLSGAPLPLLPLQILFLNLVTDVFPALALGVGEGSRRSMQRPPRPAAEPILMRRHWLYIALYGGVIAFTVLGAMAISVFYLHFSPGAAVTVSFCTLALAQMWHVFNMRDEVGEIIDNEITRNRWVFAALGLCAVLVMAAVYLPGLADVLALRDPGAAGWALIVAASLVPLCMAPAIGALANALLRAGQPDADVGASR